MIAVTVVRPGDETQLKLAEVPDPVPGPQDLLIRVRFTALNRADLLQRQGMYPPPPGASEILGLECAGEVIEIGQELSGWRIGDRAMALLPGGGYAQKAVVHHGSAMHVPAALSDEEAGAIPEVFLTAFLNLFMLGDIRAGQSALVHGGGSGVGTAAIALLREAGAQCIVTAGSADKCERCLRIGAEVAINYNEGPFAPRVRTATSGHGVDVILDCVGGAYLAPNLEAMAQGGRLVLIGLMKGAHAEIDLAAVMRRHLQIIGSTLRTRSVEAKARIVEAFIQRFGKSLESGAVRPTIDCVLPMAQVAEAHRRMQSSTHFGKIVLRVD
jgi:tumor protein p53-inducible protein 3